MRIMEMEESTIDIMDRDFVLPPILHMINRPEIFWPGTMRTYFWDNMKIVSKLARVGHV